MATSRILFRAALLLAVMAGCGKKAETVPPGYVPPVPKSTGDMLKLSVTKKTDDEGADPQNVGAGAVAVVEFTNNGIELLSSAMIVCKALDADGRELETVEEQIDGIPPTVTTTRKLQFKTPAAKVSKFTVLAKEARFDAESTYVPKKL